MADIPTCQNFAAGKRKGIRVCTRSDMRLNKETEEYWTFACASCHSVQVRSKPRAIGKARFEKMEQAVKGMPGSGKAYAFLKGAN